MNTEDSKKVQMENLGRVEGYLMDKHVVEVVGEAPGEGVPQVAEQVLLLLHGQQFVVTYIRKKADRQTEVNLKTLHPMKLHCIFYLICPLFL